MANMEAWQFNRDILDDLCAAVERERSIATEKASEWQPVRNALLSSGSSGATLLKAEDIDEQLKEGSTTVIRIDGKKFIAEVVGMAFGELDLLIKNCDLISGLKVEYRIPFDDYLTTLYDFLQGKVFEVNSDKFPKSSLALANAVVSPLGNRKAAGSRVSYVMGAPGSGKTEELVQKALALVFSGMRVMVVTYTNAAADIIFGRLASRLADEPSVQLARLGLTEASLEIEKRADSDNVRSTMAIAQAMEGNLMVTTAYRALMCAKNEVGTHSVVLFDEASTLPISLAWAGSLVATERIVLYGDPFQLGPIGQSEPLREHTLRQRFATSPFEIEGVMKAAEADQSQVVLQRQYRLPSALANATCPPLYQTSINSTRNLLNDTQSPWGVGSLLYVDSSKLEATCQKTQRGSRRNEIHADLVVELVRAMLEQEVVAADDIAKSLLIITPYRAQRSLISNRLEETRWIAKMQIRALVTTVHRAQGSEREYVILDVTDAPNFDRDVFLPVGRLWEGEGLQSNGSRLLNTALTRARKQALVVLHRDFIRNSSAVRSGIVKALPSLNDKLDRWGMPATIKFDSPESKEC